MGNRFDRVFAVLFVGGLAAIFGASCSTLDSLVGIDPASGTADPGGGIIGTGSSILSGIVPWAGAGLGAIATIYSQLRRKKYADCLRSTLSGIDSIRSLRSESGEIRLSDDRLVQILREIQAGAKTEKLVQKVLEKERTKSNDSSK
tara:strand:+ start:312 stop:749 length:438 start_codon:yes stop_codon:yes gene_type:complete